jgi:hypothetical protein
MHQLEVNMSLEVLVYYDCACCVLAVLLLHCIFSTTSCASTAIVNYSTYYR